MLGFCEGLTREFMATLLQRNQPTARDTQVFNESVHEILVVDGFDYYPTETTDLMELSELCGDRDCHPGNWMALLNTRSPGSVTSDSAARRLTAGNQTRRVNFAEGSGDTRSAARGIDRMRCKPTNL